MLPVQIIFFAKKLAPAPCSLYINGPSNAGAVTPETWLHDPTLPMGITSVYEGYAKRAERTRSFQYVDMSVVKYAIPSNYVEKKWRS